MGEPNVDSGAAELDGGVGLPDIPQLPPRGSVEDLVAADERARSKLTGLTIGGQPARTTH